MNRKTFLSSLASTPLIGASVINPKGDFKFEEGQKVWYWDCSDGPPQKGDGYKGKIREGVVQFDKWAYRSPEHGVRIFYQINGKFIVECDIFDNKEDANKSFLEELKS